MPNPFARNERVILEFSGAAGTHVLVMVGALFVGSMATVWHGDIARSGTHGVVTLPLPTDASGHLARGAEVGRFNMGSTVILLLPARMGAWQEDLADLSVLRFGQTIGRGGCGRRPQWTRPRSDGS